MLSPHLSQRLGQRQRLLQTPSMRLTMRILAIQASDLRRLISKNVDDNPYLEMSVDSKMNEILPDGFGYTVIRQTLHWVN